MSVPACPPTPCAPATRIPQPRPRPGRKPYGNQFDPAVASLGMSVDSACGPVDLVAVERALAGIPCPLTRADLGYLYGHLHRATAPLDQVAAALGVRLDTVKRQGERHRPAEQVAR